jgi:23S rRNA pseudouridine2605 synthase
MEFMRINRFLAEAGIASRRKSEDYVKAGRVSVNGQIVRDLGLQVAERDEIRLDGKILTHPKTGSDSQILIALYKPKGYLTSHSDKFHNQTVFHLLPEKFAKFKFSGRLDLDSRGLLLLSNSGDWIQKLTHPSLGPEKEYMVRLNQSLDSQIVGKEFYIGIRDQGETLRAISVSPKQGESKTFSIVLTEGKKRQIRRMFLKMGARVLDLCRTRIGKLRLDSLSLREGEWKEIRIAEVITEKED